MKVRQATIKVWNIHKDKKWAIIRTLVVNGLYAFAANAIPTLISSRIDAGVLAAQCIFYAFFVNLLSRPKYETAIGKFYFWLALVIGGFSGYKVFS